jgi:hypothetical protein
MPGFDRPKFRLVHRRQRETLPLGLVAMLGFCLVAALAAVVLILIFGAPEFTTPPPDR